MLFGGEIFTGNLRGMRETIERFAKKGIVEIAVPLNDTILFSFHATSLLISIP